MGPQCASQIEDLSTQEFNEIKKTKSPEDFATQIYEKIIQPALAQYEVDRKHEQDQINEQIQAIQKQITKETGTKRQQAKEKFDNSMEVIINIIQKMKKIESRLRRNAKRLNALQYDDTSSESNDSDKDDADTADKIRKLQNKRDGLETEIKQLQTALFKHFDQTL